MTFREETHEAVDTGPEPLHEHLWGRYVEWTSGDGQLCAGVLLRIEPAFKRTPHTIEPAIMAIVMWKVRGTEPTGDIEVRLDFADVTIVEDIAQMQRRHEKERLYREMKNLRESQKR